MSSQQWMVVSAMVSMVLWTISYGLIIRRGFLDKTYGMPFVALCPNIAYEFTYGFIKPLTPPLYIANIVWFVVDCIIVGQYLYFGRKESELQLPFWLFAGRFFVFSGLWVLAALGLTHDLGLATGNSYMGWGCQIILSGGYLFMIVRRPKLEGQSIYITLTRLIGSLAVIPAQEVEAPGLHFLWTMYATFILLDCAYIVLYLRRARELGINPWRRL